MLTLYRSAAAEEYSATTPLQYCYLLRVFVLYFTVGYTLELPNQSTMCRTLQARPAEVATCCTHYTQTKFPQAHYFEVYTLRTCVRSM